MDHSSSLSGSALASDSSFERNHVIPSACFFWRAHVSSPTLAICREGGAPDAPRGGDLGAVPVGNVTYALGRQGVARVAASSSTLDRAPGIDEVVHHLADTRPSETPSQRATCSRGIIGWSVTRSSVRFSDRLTPKAAAACASRSGRGSDARFRLGDSVRSPPPGLPWELTVSSVWYELPTPREFAPEAKVPSFERVPRLHGDEAVIEVQVYAEPRRQPLLPDAGGQDQRGFGAARVVVPRYGPQPVVERPAPQGQALADHAERPAVVEGVMVASKRPLRWNSTRDRRPSMPGESDAARR